MEEVSVDRSSAKIDHEPAIKKYSEFHKKEIQQTKKFFKRCFMLILTAVLLASMLLLSNSVRDRVVEKYQSDPNKTFYYKLAHSSFAIVVALNVFLVIYFIFLITKMIIKIHSPEAILLPNVLEHFAMQFSQMATLIVLSCLAPHELYYPAGTLAREKQSWLFGLHVWETSKSCDSSQIYSIYLPAIFKILGVLLVRDLVIYLLNFNVHYKYYEKRVEQNTEKINILRAMTDITNAGYVGDVDIIAKRFIQVVSQNGPVTQCTLQTFFSEEVSYKIFKHCNKTSTDSELTEEEVKEFYISTLVEQQAIVKSIEQHNATVDSFRGVLNVLIIPVCLYQFLSMILFINREDSEIMKNTYFLGTLVFSMNYTFSESFKGFVSSLGFIFFIRPYEVGDLFILNGKLYKVHEINLLTTVLFDGCNYTVFSNSKLSGESITNLRLNRVWDVEYTTTFKLADFEAKNAMMLLAINDYVNKKSSEFRKNAYLSKIVPKDGGKVEATILVKFNSDVSDIEVLSKRKADFFFKLQEIFKGVELLPLKE
ncbi:uncharacterized protein VICG_01302 [Vittaforma corneae ATCC 50505]|uniref:Mechanosensitive ion channel MscS domain-containing protein n=1 Tax=Vittaforma corneae (strain ATCC 50505) TaxID=993615 RepID=L2GM22_VITCO|nr:uncharacterized protein VICG_01302 [Vittaforma corneae ATCC 50505]ELA41669.1 hypothetical protein VICG_01302 [Vittaforma corneae ATCC 50505]